MKKRLLAFLTAICMLFSLNTIPLKVQKVYAETTSVASGTCGENVTWVLDSEGTLLINGSGDMYNYSYQSSPFYQYKDQVKSVIIGYGVTNIGDWTFMECINLTSISIPVGVISIGNGVFSNCSSLTNITLPVGVISMGNGVFMNCSSLTSISLPDSVRSIGTNVFIDCRSLANIILPTNLTSIGDYTFQSCSSLTSINLPEGVTSIGNYAFQGCISLTNIIIPTTLINIGNLAFESCSITSISLPDGLKNIGGGAFNNCNRLISINIPDGLKMIEAQTFSDCSSLISINLPVGLTSLGYGVFMNCSSLTSISLPNGLTSIENSTFSGCSSLESINLSVKLTSIRDSAFLNCSSLSSISLPEGITSIENSAFNGCKSLANINLSSSLTIIGPSAFLDCSSLISISLPDGVTTIGDNAFYECSSLTSINLPDSLTSMGRFAFYKCSSLKSISLPVRVSSIESDTFEGCINLTSISLPDGLTSIGGAAFAGCSRLTSIILPNGVKSIGSSAFQGCSSLTSINLPDGIKSIEKGTFVECRSLRSISLPDGVTSIGSFAFYSTDSLEKIILPESINSLAEGIFDDWDLGFYVIPNSYAYNYVVSHGYSFSYLFNPEISYPMNSFLSFRDDYQYLKVFDIDLLSNLINHSPDIPFQDIIFSVSDDSIAMISDGNIAGIGEGSCTVTASYGNLSTMFTLVVSNSDSTVSATGISLNEETLTINKGLQSVVKPTITPVTATERTVTWSSSDSSILTVENGYITAVAPGTATVTASINGFSDTIEVTVKAPLLALAVDNDDFTVNRNETHKIYCYHYPYDTTDDKTVTYTSSDESVAMVDSKGLVTGIAPGTTTILLSNGAIQKSVKVTVTSRMSGISLNKTSLNGIKNTSERLSVNFNPVDTTDDKTINWSSGNTSIATVDSNGLVTLISKGITTITATVGNYSAICTIIVTDIPLKSISLNATELSMTYGEKSSLAVTYAPTNTTDDKTVTWTSSDELVATVTTDGTVTAVGNGTATITATTADVKQTATCMVTVAVPVTGVTLDKSILSFTAFGQAESLVATIAPLNAANKNVTWTSSDELVARVSTDGTVTAAGNGTATITATTEDGNQAAACTVTVAVPVTSVTLDKSILNFTEFGQSDKLTATIAPLHAANKTVAWTSSDELVATVSAGGTVTAIGNGTVMITATTADGNQTATCRVTVAVPVTGVVLEKSELSFTEFGQTESLVATIAPLDAANKNVTWTSSEALVATVTTDGIIKAVGNGTATITVTTADGNQTATCRVTVAVPVTGVVLEKSELSFTEFGQTDNLVVTIAPLDAANKTVTWTSSDALVATVTTDGIIKAVGNGTATITVTTADGNQTAACTVTVAVPVSEVTLDKNILSFTAFGQTESLVATITPLNAANKTVTWTSSDELVATVTTDGTVTAVGNGTATITAMTADGNQTATCTVTVAVPVNGVVLNKSELSFTEYGQTENLVATIAPLNVANKNVTWTSSDKTVAAVSEDGTVTAVGNGTATITATTADGNKIATCTVTVDVVKDYSGIYNIRSVNSDLVMDVYDGGTKEGTNIIQWGCHGRENQQWRFESLENGYYKITSVLNPTYSLDVYDAGTSIGNRVIQWTYHGGTNQQWKVLENADGSVTLMSRLAAESGTGYVLDVFGGGKEPGVNVIQWSGNGGDNQKWNLEPVKTYAMSYDSNGGSTVTSSSVRTDALAAEPQAPRKEGMIFAGWYRDQALTAPWNFATDRMPAEDMTLYAKWQTDLSGTYVIRSVNSDLVMDVYDGGTTEGTNIIQWGYHGRENQQWRFESLGNGYYKITSVLNPAYSLDVYDAGTSEGNRVIQWTYHGGTNQQWKVTENADGSYTLMSRLAVESDTGYVLDVFGGGKEPGVNVIQWSGNGGDNQKWNLEAVN